MKGVLYVATCMRCGEQHQFSTYDARAEWVGEHRVKTGHPVGMSLEKP